MSEIRRIVCTTNRIESVNARICRAVKARGFVDADTQLVVATARPVPGNTADAKAWRDSGLAAHCEGVTVLGDGAYIITVLLTTYMHAGLGPGFADTEEASVSGESRH
ncbi:hypothetical protein ACPC37_00155 [Streptomyces griseoincarnatus]|uniref:hypothetical protein n=1 Tax=Streptomyces cellulosae TaxID=1968 RepID=UPI00307C760B